MEEVDDTIINILRSIGCPLDGKQSIRDFESNDIYQSAVAVLRSVNPETKFRDSLPVGQAARFRVCQKVADVIKDELGWAGQLEYQQFLYPNEKDMRKLLLWLVEKLPRGGSSSGGSSGGLADDPHGEEEDGLAEDEDDLDGVGRGSGSSGQGVGGSGELLLHQVDHALRSWSRTRFNPLQGAWERCHSREVCSLPFDAVPLTFPRADTSNSDTRDYFARLQRSFAGQPGQPRAQLAASVLEHHLVLQVRAEEAVLRQQQLQSRALEQERMVSSLLAEAFRGVETRFETSAAHQKATALAGNKTLFTRRTEFMQDRSEKEVVQTQDALSAQAQLRQAADADAAAQAEADARAQELAQLRTRREEELAKLERRLEKLRNLQQKMVQGLQDNQAGIRQIESQLLRMGDDTVSLEEAYKVKKQTLDLLPNAAANLKQLQELAKSNSQRLLALGQEWEQYRGPIVDEIRLKKQALGGFESELSGKVAQIKHIKQQLRVQLSEVKQKEILHQRIAAEYEKLPGKQINRQAYVRRIMEIVRNLDKQKEDIRKVLEDVHKLQSEIAAVGSKSQRSFAIADEIVYQSAKSRKDPEATQCYQSLVEMREAFLALVDSVEMCGKLSVEINEITSQIDGIEQRNTNLNMERILADLSAVQGENQQLKQQIKHLLA